jgi:gas vesicle protein
MTDLLTEQTNTTGSSGFGMGFAAGIALGSVLGAALALLLTPESGEAVRGQISDTSAQAKDRANMMAGKVREQASALQGQAQGALGQARDRVMALTGSDADQVITMPNTQAADRENIQGQMGDSPTIAMRDATAPNNP